MIRCCVMMTQDDIQDHVNPCELYTILQNFRELDEAGFGANYHPKDFMTTLLPIIPAKLRPKTMIASESTPSKVVTWTIQNFIQKYIAASEPEEIAVTAYQVVLVSPDGNIQSSAAEVTLKTALPLPNNAQVKDIVAVYASEDGVLHVYRANAQTQGNGITSVAFYAPVSSIYFICYTLKISE